MANLIREQWRLHDVREDISYLGPVATGLEFHEGRLGFETLADRPVKYTTVILTYTPDRVLATFAVGGSYKVKPDGFTDPDHLRFQAHAIGKVSTLHVLDPAVAAGKEPAPAGDRMAAQIARALRFDLADNAHADLRLRIATHLITGRAHARIKSFKSLKRITRERPRCQN